MSSTDTSSTLGRRALAASDPAANPPTNSLRVMALLFHFICPLSHPLPRSGIMVAVMADTRKLRDLAGVGKAFLKDFELLGIANVDQLKKQDGRQLYARLCELTGTRQEPCVEDTLVCAVAQARNPNLQSEKRNWWYYSRLRKASGT